MPTRKVVLTDRQEQLIEALVRSGRYQDAGEVLREGLRLLARREAEDAARLVALREAAGVGIEALERGAFREFAEPEELVAHLEARWKRTLAALGAHGGAWSGAEIAAFARAEVAREDPAEGRRINPEQNGPFGVLRAFNDSVGR